MLKNKKSILLNVILVFILICFIVINLYIFVSGPDFKVKDEQLKIHHKMAKQLNSQTSTFLNAFVMDEIVYVSIFTYDNQSEIVFYTKDFEVLDKRDAKEYAIEHVKQTITNKYGLKEFTMKLGYYQKQPVISISTHEIELLVDFDHLEEVLRYEKEVIR
ncbi:hypothetical protein EII25_07170 [Erysipelotrichaceae bacterium OH741_COT-311]|nr:hypothetical protein EII25_07170 [Erysipelotrichaceae bacterium OH741_COT-311]